LEKILLVSPEKCIGCNLCVLACSLKKERAFSPSKSRVQVTRWPQEAINIPTICEHCAQPPCHDACPTQAIYREETSGIVRLEEDKCIGCRLCIPSCPMGALHMDLEKRVAVKCDLCDGDPACVPVCPTQALTYVEATSENLSLKRASIEKNFVLRSEFPPLFKSSPLKEVISR